jgi:hypothetical protein
MTETTTIKVENQAPGTQEAPQAANGGAPPVNWESEIQLVSSLAKLQELERKVSIQRFCAAMNLSKKSGHGFSSSSEGQ